VPCRLGEIRGPHLFHDNAQHQPLRMCLLYARHLRCRLVHHAFCPCFPCLPCFELLLAFLVRSLKPAGLETPGGQTVQKRRTSAPHCLLKNRASHGSCAPGRHLLAFQVSMTTNRVPSTQVPEMNFGATTHSARGERAYLFTGLAAALSRSCVDGASGIVGGRQHVLALLTATRVLLLQNKDESKSPYLKTPEAPRGAKKKSQSRVTSYAATRPDSLPRARHAAVSAPKERAARPGRTLRFCGLRAAGLRWRSRDSSSRLFWFTKKLVGTRERAARDGCVPAVVLIAG